jgi:hypothetical protein
MIFSENAAIDNHTSEAEAKKAPGFVHNLTKRPLKWLQKPAD